MTAKPQAPARILVSGSVAYDTIMVFAGRFRDHILPERTHMLNVAFLAPEMKREHGGTAANIAYSLARLGSHATVLATTGRDGDATVERLASFGVDVSAIRRCDDHWTAQAFITTDLDDNQITAFHPGAMARAHEVRVEDHLPAAWGIVSPNGKDAMLAHAAAFRAAGIAWIFDPGQAMPMFDGDELRALIDGATAITVNDYECSLLTSKTGLDEAALARHVEALIVTRGGEGSTVWTKGEAHVIAAAPISKAVDPTGCGDAFRAGLLHGRASGLDWLASARLGSVLGAIKIEREGAQNHPVDLAEIAARHEAAFGSRPW